jgi:hypothetical protein
MSYKIKNFGKKKNNQGLKGFGDPIKWRNVPHEAEFNPNKLWYGVIKIGDKNYTVEYESQFRSEVQAIFEEESRLCGGKLEYIGTYK